MGVTISPLLMDRFADEGIHPKNAWEAWKSYMYLFSALLDVCDVMFFTIRTKNKGKKRGKVKMKIEFALNKLLKNQVEKGKLSDYAARELMSSLLRWNADERARSRDLIDLASDYTIQTH
jgi:hypothetical protein